MASILQRNDAGEYCGRDAYLFGRVKDALEKSGDGELDKL